MVFAVIAGVDFRAFAASDLGGLDPLGLIGLDPPALGVICFLVIFK